MVGLYLSGWNPAGAKRAWDRCSMEPTSTRTFLGHWAQMPKLGELVEAVAWFEPEGALRILVADFDSGRRILLRAGSRNTSVSFQRWREAAPSGVATVTEGEGSREELKP